MDTRLFMPAQWFTEDDKERRAKCNVPEDATLHTKPQWAATRLQAIAHEGLVPCRDVVADCLYGHSPAFLDAVDAWVGVTTLVAMPSEPRGGLQRPRTEDKTSISQGDVQAKRVVGAPPTAPRSVAAWAASLPAASWYQRTVSEGPTGPIE